MPIPYQTVRDLHHLRDLINEWREHDVVCCDTETTGLDIIKDEVVGLAVATAHGDGINKGYYAPFLHEGYAKNIDPDDALALMQPVFETVDTVWHNAVFDLGILDKYGVQVKQPHDTMMMSYVRDVTRDPRGHGMDYLAKKYFDYRTIKIKEVWPGKGTKFLDASEDFRLIPVDRATWYAAEDVDVTLDLFFELCDKLREIGCWDVYNLIDRPTIHALTEMALNGIAVDLKHTADLDCSYKQRMHEAHQKIQEVAPGLEYPSPSKLANYMFDELKLTPLQRSKKTGAPSADKEALEFYEDDHPVFSDILEWRRLSKLHSTYIKAIQEKHDKATRRIHPTLKPTGTATARYASADPNAQNIPSRGQGGKDLRRAFIAGPGRKIVCADYSQIELRILAHVANELRLIQAFHDGRDPHDETTMAVWNLTKDDPRWEDQRKIAKNVNFGVVYGVTSIGLAKQIKQPPSEAQDVIDRFYFAYPGVRQWIEGQHELASTGYVHTMFGRRLPLGYGFGKDRQAQNYPIQGAAADLMRLALGMIARELPLQFPTASLLLTVHDEVLVECDDRDVEGVKKLVERCMVTCADQFVQWKVPILVEAKDGQSWKDAK